MAGERSLADKLNHLFARHTSRSGQEYSNEQVAAAIADTGVTISQSYIWQLRKGKKDNPTFKHLQALAGFFGVPVSYFFDDEVTDRVNEQLKSLQDEQSRLNEIASGSDAQLMAMRAGELSPDRRRLVMELLDVVYRQEQAERGEGSLVAERELRKRCRRLLNELDIQPPLDVEELCRRVGDQRGRPIRLIAHPIPVPGPYGVWIATAKADYILYQQETSKAHQNHIILHELGHLLAGHTSDEQDDDLLAGLYPDLEPDAVRRALRRTSYDTAHEREAETVATIILEWASVLDKVAPRNSEGPARRMAKSLADRIGWL